jgi:hypothetical protein
MYACNYLVPLNSSTVAHMGLGSDEFRPIASRRFQGTIVLVR